MWKSVKWRKKSLELVTMQFFARPVCVICWGFFRVRSCPPPIGYIYMGPILKKDTFWRRDHSLHTKVKKIVTTLEGVNLALEAGCIRLSHIRCNHFSFKPKIKMLYEFMLYGNGEAICSFFQLSKNFFFFFWKCS